MMSYGDPTAQSWALPEPLAEPIVRRAVDAGITFFDTADMYSDGESEVLTGRLLAKLFSRRDDYVLASKVFYPTGPGANDRGLSRAHILSAIDSSLRRLGTDHLDLYQVHRFDAETPVEETMRALEDVVRAGKVRYIGASGMAAWQVAKMQTAAMVLDSTLFVSVQTRYNLVNREDERELLPMCRDTGIGVLPYSPLARGLLAGARTRDGGGSTPRSAATSPHRAEDFDVADDVREVAAMHEAPCSSIALAWLLGKDGIAAPVIGATAEHHIDDAVRALAIDLEEAELRGLEARYVPRLVTDYS
jgi:aryl-alcohol dehydrogenase-like predicted oxidoreductase